MSTKLLAVKSTVSSANYTPYKYTFDAAIRKAYSAAYCDAFDTTLFSTISDSNKFSIKPA